MNSVLELLCVLIATATLSLGCSPPEGGYVKPTEAEMIHSSDVVLVGRVMNRIYPDPYYTNTYENMTYGAQVQVRCSYKGGTLGDTITIHRAGAIPGHCTDMRLDKDQEYLIFLDGPETETKSYSQTYLAQQYSSTVMEKVLKVCNLEMKYPMENGMTLTRKVCPEASKTNCPRYSPDSKVNPKNTGPARTPDVSIELKGGNSTTSNPGGGATASTASLILLTLGPLFWCLFQ